MKKILIPLILILSVTTAFAGERLEIYTWGYGDLMENALIAMKTIVGGGLYALLKICALVGAVVLIMTAVQKGNWTMTTIKFFLIVLVSMYFFQNKVDVAIIDAYDPANTRLLDDVPRGTADLIHIFSTIDKKVHKIYNDALTHTPAGYDASELYFPAIFNNSLIYQASQFRIVDPNINMTLNEYMSSCVFPEIISGYFNSSTLMRSPTFWLDIKNTHPVRSSRIYSSLAELDVDSVRASVIDGYAVYSCPKVYKYLDSQLNTYFSTASEQLNLAMGLSTSINLDAMLGQASGFFMNYSTTGKNFLMQATAMNHFSDSYNVWATANGVSSEALSYGSAKAQESTRMNMAISGIQAKKWLPVARGMITIIFVCMLPIIIIFSATFFMDMKMITGIFGMFVVLSIWSVGDAVINFIVMVKTANMMGPGTGALTLVAKPIIEESAINAINMASSMYWLVPTIAFVIGSGFSVVAMKGVVSGLTAPASSGVGAAAGEAASGSASHANVNAENTRMHNMMTAHMTNQGRMSNYSNTSTMDTGYDYRTHSTSTAMGPVKIPSMGVSGGVQKAFENAGAGGFTSLSNIQANTEAKKLIDGSIQYGSGTVGKAVDANGNSVSFIINGGMTVDESGKIATASGVNFEARDASGVKQYSAADLSISGDNINQGRIFQDTDGLQFSIQGNQMVSNRQDKHGIVTDEYQREPDGSWSLINTKFSTREDMVVDGHTVKAGSEINMQYGQKPIKHADGTTTHTKDKGIATIKGSDGGMLTMQLSDANLSFDGEEPSLTGHMDGYYSDGQKVNERHHPTLNFHGSQLTGAVEKTTADGSRTTVTGTDSEGFNRNIVYDNKANKVVTDIGEKTSASEDFHGVHLNNAKLTKTADGQVTARGIDNDGFDRTVTYDNAKGSIVSDKGERTYSESEPHRQQGDTFMGAGVETLTGNGVHTFRGKTYDSNGNSRGDSTVSWTSEGVLTDRGTQLNTESRTFNSPNGPQISTHTGEGAWETVGNYKTFNGPMSWRDINGRTHTGSGTFTTDENGTVRSAMAVSGNDFTDKNRNVLMIEEGAEVKNVLPAVLAGNSGAVRQLSNDMAELNLAKRLYDDTLKQYPAGTVENNSVRNGARKSYLHALDKANATHQTFMEDYIKGMNVMSTYSKQSRQQNTASGGFGANMSASAGTGGSAGASAGASGNASYTKAWINSETADFNAGYMAVSDAIKRIGEKNGLDENKMEQDIYKLLRVQVENFNDPDAIKGFVDSYERRDNPESKNHIKDSIDMNKETNPSIHKK